MKTIQIEIPEGYRAEWANGVLALVDEPKKCHEFKVGDKAFLNKDVCFLQVSGDYVPVNAGSQVEIVKVFNSADATEKTYRIKHQNSAGTVLGRYLSKIESKFNVGDKVKCPVNPSETYTIKSIGFQDGKYIYALESDTTKTYVAENLIEPIPQNIIERIKTFEDAVEWCEQNNHSYLRSQYKDIRFYLNGMKGSSDLIAYLKLRIITAALNEGWEPTFAEDEERWRVVYDAVDGSYGSGCSLKWETTPNKLIFKSEELAQYVAEQFCDIYADFCGCEKSF